MTNSLTFNVFDFTDHALKQEATTSLWRSDFVISSNKFIPKGSITKTAAADGIVVFDLVPTSDLRLRTHYTLEIGEYKAYIIMPNRDVTFNPNDGTIVIDPSAIDIAADNAARLLPVFPPEGERNNKIAKFDGDILDWKVDAGGLSLIHI